MVKISVIIPVFNGEDYIRACIDSVLNQTLQDFEIIIVNDASTDKTKGIIDEYLANNEKISVITKENNNGQGSARNIGINKASGEFITFVDSDDTISNDMLEKMYNEAINKDADVVVCDYYEIKEEKRFTKKALFKVSKDLKRDYIVSIAGPCNKLIKTSILKENNLEFLEILAYEDLSIMPVIGLYSERISYLEEPLYNYYIRHGSTMRQNTFNKKLLSIYDSLENLTKEFERSGLINQYHEELEFIYIKHLLYAGTGRFLEYKEGRKEVKKIVSVIKERYPNWKKNKYYKLQDTLFKLNCNIFYSGKMLIIVPFRKVINFIK